MVCESRLSGDIGATLGYSSFDWVEPVSLSPLVENSRNVVAKYTICRISLFCEEDTIQRN